jgi:hypothetical protein
MAALPHWTTKKVRSAYSAPRITELGRLDELTLGCDKRFGSSDGFTFMGQSIVCASP